MVGIPGQWLLKKILITMTLCDINKLVSIYKLVECNPGLTPADLTRVAQLGKTYLYNQGLNQMEEYGFLLYEDSRRGLHPYTTTGRAREIVEARQSGRLLPDEVIKVSCVRRSSHMY